MVRISSTYNTRWIFLASLLFLACWSVVHTIAMHRLGHGWRISMTDALVWNVAAMIAVVAITKLFQVYQPRASSGLYRLIITISITVAACALSQFTLEYLLANDHAYVSFLNGGMPVRFMITFLITGAVTVVSWLLRRVDESGAYERKQEETHKLVREAELVKLRQQLQPHFLFNSLNSISALSVSRPEEARTMIQQLSDFLRATMRRDEQALVDVSDELAQLKLYLAIEQVRFGHRLQVQIQMKEETMKCRIPPLLLQPVVENAIKFGLYGTIDHVVVDVEITCENNLLHVTVKNPYDEASAKSAAGTGFGLASIQKRLLLLYNRNDLIATSGESGIFTTRLKIPQT